MTEDEKFEDFLYDIEVLLKDMRELPLGFCPEGVAQLREKVEYYQQIQEEKKK